MKYHCPICNTLHDSRLDCRPLIRPPVDFNCRCDPGPFSAEDIACFEQLTGQKITGRSEPMKTKIPRWYLDAMREGNAVVCWEVATRWQKITAWVFYTLRF